MTFQRNDLLYLHDIYEATAKIEEFVGKMSYDEFSKDEKTQSLRNQIKTIIEQQNK
jgi:uncharacterized protein with HEPN domain